jgi:hypothetical protein
MRSYRNFKHVWLQVMLPAHSAGHPGNLILFFFELCRFIPAYKAGLSRHLPVTCNLSLITPVFPF